MQGLLPNTQCSPLASFTRGQLESSMSCCSHIIPKHIKDSNRLLSSIWFIFQHYSVQVYTASTEMGAKDQKPPHSLDLNPLYEQWYWRPITSSKLHSTWSRWHHFM